jgi:monothiol glutaredoxin
MFSGLKNPFRIATPQTAVAAGRPIAELDRSLPARERVERLVRDADVVLLMKGTPERPMCGFSANTVAILEEVGVPYASFDVLSDDEIRAAAKEYGQWPTFPQVWLRGELIGGHDIVTDMQRSGELAPLLRGRVR